MYKRQAQNGAKTILVEKDAVLNGHGVGGTVHPIAVIVIVIALLAMIVAITFVAVSYTHLDVYKRQA